MEIVMAGRPPKPTNVLTLTGGFRKDRHARRLAEPTEGVGAPPDRLGATERAIWRETARAASAWLRRSDRGLMELYSRLLAEARADIGTMPAARLSVLVGIAGRLALSPCDRARVAGDDGEPGRSQVEREYFHD
jgi:hypothetical protein